jgi:hypothetical protein
MIRQLTAALALLAPLLAAIPAVFVSTPAEAQTRRAVRFVFVYTLPAKARLNTLGITPTAFAQAEIAKMNAAFTNSTMATRAEYGGYNDQGICCGANFGDTGDFYPDSATGQSSLAWASNSPAVHKAREDAWADVVVVVTDDPAMVGTAGYNYNKCSAADRGAKKSIIGATIQAALTQGTATHEAGHTMCGDHDKDDPSDPGTNHGHYWVTGVPGNCMIHGDIMSRPKAVTATVTNWTVGENGLIVTPGEGPTADQANLVMTGNCPQVTGYRCTVVGSCQILNPASAQCTHYRIPPSPGSPQFITSFGTALTNTFTCPITSWVREPIFSNLTTPHGGVIPGTSTANNAAAIDAGSLVTQGYRDVIVSKSLITASQ